MGSSPIPGASCHPSHTSWATLFLSPLSYLHATDNRIEKNISIHLGFPGGSAGKESTCNAGDLGLIPGWGRSPGEENGSPLQYSGLENFMNCIGVHGVLQVRTLKWVAMPSSRGSSQPRDQTQVSGIAGGFFTIWATREAQVWPKSNPLESYSGSEQMDSRDLIW